MPNMIRHQGEIYVEAGDHGQGYFQHQQSKKKSPKPRPMPAGFDRKKDPMQHPQKHKKCEKGTHWNEDHKKCEKLPPGLQSKVSRAHKATAKAKGSKFRSMFDSSPVSLHHKAEQAHDAASAHAKKLGFKDLAKQHTSYSHRHRDKMNSFLG